MPPAMNRAVASPAMACTAAATSRARVYVNAFTALHPHATRAEARTFNPVFGGDPGQIDHVLVAKASRPRLTPLACEVLFRTPAADSVWARVCLTTAPTPVEVLALGHERLTAYGLSQRKAEYILDLARHFFVATELLGVNAASASK